MTAPATCPECGQRRPTCRSCGDVLTEDNARRSRGRFVGACRPCESDEVAARSAARARRRAAERSR